MKKLVYDNITAQYIIENEPNLFVLGVDDDHSFKWINGDIDAVDNPAQLEEVLRDEAYYLPVNFDGEEAQALVIHTGRLMALTGRPVNRNDAWAVIAALVEAEH